MTFNKFYEELNVNARIKLNNKINNHIAKDGKLYSLDGEYLGDYYKPNIHIKYNEKQLQSYDNVHAIADHEKENGGFVFLFYQLLKDMKEQLPNLTKPDISRLLYMTTYIQFDTNKIVHDNGRQISDKELGKLLKLQQRQYNSYIEKLIENKYMQIDNDGYKVLSEYLCKYGSLNISFLRKNNIYYNRLFKRTVREIFENSTVRELNKVSILYMMLPYMSLENNIICHNPLEQDKDNIIPMTMIELSNALGYKDCTSLRNQMYSMSVDGQKVFGFFSDDKDKRKMKVFVNPKVTYAGDAETLKFLNMLFRND